MKPKTDTAAPGADQPGQIDEAGQGAAPLDADTLADLNAIVGEAAAVDGGGQPPGAVDAGPAMSTGQQLAGILKASRLAVVPLARRRVPSISPALEEIWSEKQLEEIGDAWGVIFDINGWTLGGVMDKWGPYVMAAVATVPPVWATYELVQELKAQAEAQRQAGRGQAVTPPAP